MAIKGVKAWETTDGKLFRYSQKKLAEHHQINISKQLENKTKFSNIKLELQKTLGIEVYQYDNGWKCNKSPTGICIYNSADNEEECHYCGQPEERK